MPSLRIEREKSWKLKGRDYCLEEEICLRFQLCERLMRQGVREVGGFLFSR